jgi:hypothetical protein
VIDRSELVFPLNLTVNYLVNPQGTPQSPQGTTAPVAPDGQMAADGREWDLTSTQGNVYPLTLLPVEGTWFASYFPTATYATTSDLTYGTLGIFEVTDTSLRILGFASPEPNQTLMVYTTPIDSLHFPVQQGDAWVSTGQIANGKLLGMPYASMDTYDIHVDESGTAVLPFLSFASTLRVHVQLTQQLAGPSVTRIQHLFFHECYGEVGRMVSQPGETDPSFTTAAEFRRLAL